MYNNKFSNKFNFFLKTVHFLKYIHTYIYMYSVQVVFKLQMYQSLQILVEGMGIKAHNIKIKLCCLPPYHQKQANQ